MTNTQSVAATESEVPPAKRRTWSWRRGRVLAVIAAILALLTIGHRLVPGGYGVLLETFLPWLGAAVPVLVACAAIRRSRLGMAAAILPAVAWIALFGARSLPGTEGKDADLIAVQHNVADDNADPAATARALVAPRPDLIALEELTPEAEPEYARIFAAGYPYHATSGTVALWAKYPLTDIRPVDIRPEGIAPGWDRGVRATAATTYGPVAVYVAHLPSTRLSAGGLNTDLRDASARMLGAALAAEPIDRVILLGDLNATTEDRGLAPVLAQVGVDGPGFAFSFPAKAPVARIDQVMTRTAKVTDVRTLPRTGSDHLPIAAQIDM